MKPRLFIFNSERPVTRALTLILLALASVFILDRVTFGVFFPFYDQWLRVGSSLRGSDILVVGSSHIQADLDVKVVEGQSKMTVGLFSVPGASLLVRYYAIKERLEDTTIPKPRLIILETSKMVFNPSRYHDDISSYLIPYWIRCSFKEYFTAVKPAGTFWPRVFETYSLNGTFEKFTEPGNIARFFLENLMPVQKYIRFRDRMNGPVQSCLAKSESLADPRVPQWEIIRKKNGFDNTISPERITELEKITALANKYQIPIILLEVPFFRFKDEFPKDGYEKVREILNTFAKKEVRYLNISIPNESCLFADDGHLTREGRGLFTSKFIKNTSTLILQ